MIEKPMNDAMWMVIGVSIAIVIASCIIDFSKLRSQRPVPTAAATRSL